MHYSLYTSNNKVQHCLPKLVKCILLVTSLKGIFCLSTADMNPLTVPQESTILPWIAAVTFTIYSLLCHPYCFFFTLKLL